MSDELEISFEQIIDALLDAETPFPPRYLYRLSNLEGEEFTSIQQTWPQISPQRRRALLEDLEELAETNTLMQFNPLFRLALNDLEAENRTLAIRALWESEDPGLISTLQDILENDESLETRAQAAAGLGRFIYLGEFDRITEATQQSIEDVLLAVVQGDQDPLIRRRALEALGYSGRQEVRALIQQAYQPDDQDWLVSALHAMGRSCDPCWTSEVLENLHHVAPPVRLEAARAAGELEIEDARQDLLELLDDDNDEVRMAAVWSLSQIGGEGVQRALKGLLQETDDQAEIDMIEDALGNLSITEGDEAFDLFDFKDLDDFDDDDFEDGFDDQDDDDFYLDDEDDFD